MLIFDLNSLKTWTSGVAPTGKAIYQKGRAHDPTACVFYSIKRLISEHGKLGYIKFNNNSKKFSET